MAGGYVSTFGGAIPFTGVAASTYTVRVSGTAYFCVAGSLRIDMSVGRRSQASFTLYTDTTVHFQQYQQVTIFDTGGTLIFSGYITNPKEQKPGFRNSLIHSITATDQHFLADKRIIAKQYTEMTCGAIVVDIVKNYLAEEGVTLVQIFDGLTPTTTLYPSTTLYPNGNVGLIPSVVFSYCTVAAALDALVQEASSAGVPYYWMIDQNKKLYFAPYTSVAAGIVVDGSFISQSQYPSSVQRQNPKYRNIQYLTGGIAQTAEQDEVRFGDGATTAWTMGYPLYAEPTISIQNGPDGNPVLQNVGLKSLQNSTDQGLSFYWQQGDATITANNGDPALTKSQTLYIKYIGQYPSTVVIPDPTRIAAQKAIDGTSGKIEVVDEDKSLVNITTALTEASRFLTRYGVYGTGLQFSTLKNVGYAPGQLIFVDLPEHGIHQQQMLVETLSIADQDGVNVWYTVNAINGPYDTTWVNFYSQLLISNHTAQDITAGTTTGTSLAVITTPTTLITNVVATLKTITANMSTAVTTASTTGVSQAFSASLAAIVASITPTVKTSTVASVTQAFSAPLAGILANLSTNVTTSSGGGTKTYPVNSVPTTSCNNMNITSYTTKNTQPVRFMTFKDNYNQALGVDNQYISGGNVLLYWSDIETAEGNRDWTPVENALNAWKKGGKKAALRISTCGQKNWTASPPSGVSYSPKAAQGTPQWVFTAGVQNYTTKNSIVPQYWSSTFITKFNNFIAAFGAKYDGDARIEFVQVAVGMGGECKADTTISSKPTAADPQIVALKNMGFNNDVWYSFCTQTADHYATAFKKTKLCMIPGAFFNSTLFTGKHSTADIVNYVKQYKMGLQNDGIGGASGSGGSVQYTTPDPNWGTAAFISAEQRDPTTQTGDSFECDVEAIIAYCSSGSPIYALCFYEDISNSKNQSTLQKYAGVG